jgi:anti-sigma factor RsiW
MWTNRHLSNRTLIRLVDAELAARRQARAERHLDACTSCAERLRALTSVSATIRPERVLPANYASLRARLRARLASEQAALEHQGRSRELATPFAVAACAVLIAVSAIVGLGRRPAATDFTTEAMSAHVGAGLLPDPSLTPGSVTRATAADLCGPIPRADRTIAPRVRQAVLRAYKMENVPADEYELDYLITPELGGAPERENLWPERYGARTWNARVKDDLERLLPRMVCEGRLDLSVAQHDIAADWIAAYRKYFHASTPLTTYASAFDAARFVALSQLARR